MAKGKILTINEIKSIVEMVARKHGLKKVILFGSYADGTQTAESDLDFLIEFIDDEKVSLFEIFDVRHDFEDMTSKSIDVVTLPILEDSFLEIGKEVVLYEFKSA